MPNHREWLKAEQDGQDALAEMMFAHLVREIPPVEPSADFVGRTVQAAWRARARRRIVMRLAGVMAVLLTGIAAVGSIHELGVLAVGLIAHGTVVLSQGLVWLLTSASEGASWWWIAELIGTAVRKTISAPATACAIAAIEMIALLAIYAFQKVILNETGTHKSRMVQI